MINDGHSRQTRLPAYTSVRSSHKDPQTAYVTKQAVPTWQHIANTQEGVSLINLTEWTPRTKDKIRNEHVRGSVKVASVAKITVVRTCEEEERWTWGKKNGRCTGTRKEMERKTENHEEILHSVLIEIWKVCVEGGGNYSGDPRVWEHQIRRIKIRT